jgi:hypothetical protein
MLTSHTGDTHLATSLSKELTFRMKLAVHIRDICARQACQPRDAMKIKVIRRNVKCFKMRKSIHRGLKLQAWGL